MGRRTAQLLPTQLRVHQMFHTILSTLPTTKFVAGLWRSVTVLLNAPCQSYFDVDTNTVLKRVGMAMIPQEGFVSGVCEGHIDLYGKSRYTIVMF